MSHDSISSWGTWIKYCLQRKSSSGQLPKTWIQELEIIKKLSGYGRKRGSKVTWSPQGGQNFEEKCLWKGGPIESEWKVMPRKTIVGKTFSERFFNIFLSKSRILVSQQIKPEISPTQAFKGPMQDLNGPKHSSDGPMCGRKGPPSDWKISRQGWKGTTQVGKELTKHSNESVWDWTNSRLKFVNAGLKCVNAGFN